MWPSTSTLIPIIINEYHTGTHERFLKTLHRIPVVLFWKGIRSHIKDFVKACEVCQTRKSSAIAPTELLQSLLILDRIWGDMSMVLRIL